MVDKTLGQLITLCERELSQVPGLSVQLYTQDTLADKITAAYLFFFDDTKVQWKRFRDFATYTLSGTNGRVMETVSDTFKEFGDIEAIYPADSDDPLVLASSTRNPALITGSTPDQYGYDSTNVFRVFPLTATGQVVVVGKVRANLPFALSDTVPFDYLALQYFTCWQMAIDDASNPGAVDKFKALFDERYNELKKKDQQAPIAFNNRSSRYPTTWEEL
jgi:hypothetical protein